MTGDWLAAVPHVAVEVAAIQAWGAVGVAALTFIGGVVAVVVNRQKKRDQSYEDVTVVREHVANDHSKNLREDIDDKHREVVELLTLHIQQTNREFGLVRSELGELRRNFESERTRTRALEDTVSRTRRTPRQ